MPEAVSSQREFLYTQNIFDLLTDTHQTDASRQLKVLIANLKLQQQPNFGRLKKIAVSWAWDNHKFQRRYSGLTPNQILNEQKPIVEKTETALEQLLDIYPQKLISVEESKKLLTKMHETNLLPKKELQDDGFYLKKDKLKEFLLQHPPMVFLKGSKYQTIQEVLDDYPPELIFSLARNVDDTLWLTVQQQFFTSAKSNDLIKRPIRLEVVSRDEFPSLQKTMDVKIARGDKATGLVFFVTPNKELTQKPLALSLFVSRILHYIYEVHSFGTVFPEIFKTLEQPTIDKAATHLQALFWRGIRRRKDDDLYFFGTHSLLEAIYWQKTYEQIRNVVDKKSYPDYSGNDKLILAKNEQGESEVVGLHPMNVITQIFNGKVKENVTTKRQVRLNLLMKLLNISDLAGVEKLLLAHLPDGHIAL